MGRRPRDLTPTVSGAHLFGAELRLARQRAGLSLTDLCERFRHEGRAVHRGYLANVELGERLPEDRDFAEICDRVLDLDGLLARLWDFAETNRNSAKESARRTRLAASGILVTTLAPVMTGDIVYVPYISAPGTVSYMQMTRRAFLATGGLASASLASGLLQRDELTLAEGIAADILAGDPRGVTKAQTSHALDLTIAALIAIENMRPNPLTKWISEPPDPVLRVNATGIAAKITGSDLSDSVASVLANDSEIRHRYLTAVMFRIHHVDWNEAHKRATAPHVGQYVPSPAVDPIASQLQYRHDAGARWCAAFVLADIWSDTDHPGAPTAAGALEAALAEEPLPSLRTAYGRALSRRPLTT